MTAREREMADIKLAEGLEAEMQGTSVRRSHTSAAGGGNAAAGGAQVGMPWSDDAEEAMKALSNGQHQIVQLGIDLKDEKIVLLSAAQDTASLAIPTSDPSYTFYKHSTGVGTLTSKSADFRKYISLNLTVSHSLHLLLSRYKSYSRTYDLLVKLSANSTRCQAKGSCSFKKGESRYILYELHLFEDTEQYAHMPSLARNINAIGNHERIH